MPVDLSIIYDMETPSSQPFHPQGGAAMSPRGKGLKLPSPAGREIEGDTLALWARPLRIEYRVALVISTFTAIRHLVAGLIFGRWRRQHAPRQECRYNHK